MRPNTATGGGKHKGRHNKAATRRTSPDKVALIIAMREAGYSYSLIAEKAGVSLSTAKRVCKRHNVQAFTTTHHLTHEVRQELISSITKDEMLKSVCASLVRDTLSHAEKLREVAAAAGTQLKADNPNDAARILRGCNAWANTLKLSADAMRSALKFATFEPEDEDLPELTLRVMTEEEVSNLRAEQQAEAVRLGIQRDDDGLDKAA